MTARTENPSSAVRIRVMKRDRFQCTYCGTPGTDAELEVDHIIPVAKGGSHHMSNLTTACRTCNQKKSDGTLSVNKKHHKEPAYDGLIGMCLHTFKNGRMHFQGQIIAMDGDIALVQLYSWFDGERTKVVPISKEIIYSECVLYANHADMRDAAEQLARQYEIEDRRKEFQQSKIEQGAQA